MQGDTRSRPRRASLPVVAALCGVLTSACGADPGLDALSADAMASHEPPHTTLVSQDEQKSGTTLGKPHYAQITRVFALAPGASPPDAVTESVEVAKEHGWRGHFQQSGGGTSSWLGTRYQAGLRLELGVTVGTLPSQEGELFVYLSAHPRSPNDDRVAR